MAARVILSLVLVLSTLAFGVVPSTGARLLQLVPDTTHAVELAAIPASGQGFHFNPDAELDTTRVDWVVSAGPITVSI
jgi:hypothetical protein